MPARAQIGTKLARIFHTIRPLQDSGQRQPLDGGGSAVTGQGGGEDRLARAVGAAIGGQKHVHRRGRLAPFDAPVGQIEFGVGQGQEGDVAVAVLHRDKGGGRPARAARQTGVKAGIAAGIRGDGPQHRVGTADQINGHTGLRAGCCKAAHEDMQPVDARHRGDAKI